MPSLMVYGRSALKIEKGGDLSAAIENLVEAGFLAERSDRAARGSIHVNKRFFIGKSGRINPETGRELRERRFRIRALDRGERYYTPRPEDLGRFLQWKPAD